MNKEIAILGVQLTLPKYIIAAMLAWIVTQVIKLIHKGINGSWDWRNLYRSGNMPSSHASVVMSLVTLIGLSEGISSVEFGIASIFAGIVMYDAMNVRQAVGRHGVVIKEIIKQQKMNTKIMKNPKYYIRDSFGHTPTEVAVGAIIGILLAIAIYVV